MPVDKQPGDAVYAGTLNSSGALEVRAVKVGEETTLGQIRRLIEQAQTQKAPIERILDRHAKLYTPAALLLGALVWWWSGDLLRAITILIVFCPCAMVLATLTALVASIGNAALRGSLVKRGATVEALARVDTVVFDKTGTLTCGTPKLIRSLALNGVGERDLLHCAAIAEKFSEHPVPCKNLARVFSARLEHFRQHADNYDVVRSAGRVRGRVLVAQEHQPLPAELTVHLSMQSALQESPRSQFSEVCRPGLTA